MMATILERTRQGWWKLLWQCGECGAVQQTIGDEGPLREEQVKAERGELLCDACAYLKRKSVTKITDKEKKSV